MHWRGYGADVWGLTACDGPVDLRPIIDGAERVLHLFGARPRRRDDGTLAPTALGGSMPFAPEIVLPAMRRCTRATAGVYAATASSMLQPELRRRRAS